MLDFGVIVMGETYGRERRHRWFTFKGYKTLLNQENINEAEHGLSVDLANTGGFTDVLPELFYETLDQLHKHQDADSREETTKKKRKPPKNPILPDGTIKRGRPRKNQGGASKRKREDIEEDDEVGDQAQSSKRAKVGTAGGDEVFGASQGTPVAEPTPRKRGRPPKRKPEGETSATPTPRKRGRPPKKRTLATVGQQETQEGGGQTPSIIATLPIPAQEVAPEVTLDETGLQCPGAFGQTSQLVVTPEANILHPAGVPPPELHLPTPESREPLPTSQQDVDGVRTSYRTRRRCTQAFIRTLQAFLSNRSKRYILRSLLQDKGNPTCPMRVGTTSSIG